MNRRDFLKMAGLVAVATPVLSKIGVPLPPSGKRSVPSDALNVPNYCLHENPTMTDEDMERMYDNFMATVKATEKRRAEEIALFNHMYEKGRGKS